MSDQAMNATVLTWAYRTANAMARTAPRASWAPAAALGNAPPDSQRTANRRALLARQGETLGPVGAGR
jgi:hypothetical protein